MDELEGVGRGVCQGLDWKPLLRSGTGTAVS